MFAANTSAQQYVSSHPAGDVYYSQETGHHCLVAKNNYKTGDIITNFGASHKETNPTRYTVQQNAYTHITLDPAYLRYMNHSCDPNCFFDMERFELIALKNISPGEALNFFYPSTEWDMAEPFQCFCGASNCLGMIKGARSLPVEILKNYRLSHFIANQIHQ